MRKRTIREFWDTLFWAIIYLLPLVLFFFLIAIYKPDYEGDFSFFITLFNGILDGFMSEDNPVWTVFHQVLGGMGLGNGESWILFGWYSPIIGYLVYCALVSIAHVFFDIIVFIPRLAHKWLGKATQQD